MKSIAVIPVFNESKRIFDAIFDVIPYVDEVIVVDDCSIDDSFEVASRQDVHVLRHIINRGQGAALQTGSDYAFNVLNADIVIHFDGDGQMQGKNIPAIIQPIIEKRADVVLGSRFLGLKSNMPFARKVTLKAALVFTRMVSGIKITDPHCGFRAISRNASSSIQFQQDRMAHASEIHDLLKVSGVKFASCPVSIRYTKETISKGMSFFDGFKVLKDYFKGKFFDIL